MAYRGGRPISRSPIAEVNPLTRRLLAFKPLSGDAQQRLAALTSRQRVVAPGRDVVAEGEAHRASFVVIDGFGCRYKLMDDGRRQILKLVIPGDMVGINGHLTRAAQDSFGTLTEMVLASVPHTDMHDLRRAHPDLALAIDCAVAQENAMIEEHLLSIGRRTATERMAHFLLEMKTRLQLVGQTHDNPDDDAYVLPVTQDVIADLLGLTVVHVNRVPRKLRDRRLISMDKRRVAIEDARALIALAGIDPDYLDQIAGAGRAGRAPAICRPSQARQALAHCGPLKSCAAVDAA